MSGTPRGLKIALLVVLTIGIGSYCVSRCYYEQKNLAAENIIDNISHSRNYDNNIFSVEERNGLFREEGIYRV